MVASNKNVLVLSDNPYLCMEIFDIVSNLTDKSFKVDFGISPQSDVSLFSPIKAEKFNLKNQSEISYILRSYGLIISIHCKQLFPKELVNSIRCVNVHPGYNPFNRGWFPQVFSIINNTCIGVTIHEIDEDIDHGNIIVRELVEKKSTDTSLSLYNRIIKTEIKLLRKHFESLLENKYKTIKPEFEGNLYLKSHFKELCEIKLDERVTYRVCIDRLRALTHGEYLNAYFIDDVTGKKVYLKLELIIKK